MDRNVEATQKMVTWSCACANERGEDPPECSNAPLISDDELENTKRCIVEAATAIDAHIPPGFDDFLDCLNAHFHDADECIHRHEDDDRCSGEGRLLMLECRSPFRSTPVGDTDYDFRRLCNLANGLHDDHPHPGSLRLSADSNIPAGLVEIASQVVAYRLAEANYDDLDDLKTAFERGPATAPLFSYPAFSIRY